MLWFYFYHNYNYIINSKDSQPEPAAGCWPGCPASQVTSTMEARLLGRRSDEWFATRWTPRSGEWADRLNSLPKYVVSSTFEDPSWTNATVLTGDLVTQVSKLKQELDGEIVVYASYQLGLALIEHDLVDELRLVIFPVVLGAGERLFGEPGDKNPMRLVDATTIGNGLAVLTYEMLSGTE